MAFYLGLQSLILVYNPSVANSYVITGSLVVSSRGHIDISIMNYLIIIAIKLKLHITH